MLKHNYENLDRWFELFKKDEVTFYEVIEAVNKEHNMACDNIQKLYFKDVITFAEWEKVSEQAHKMKDEYMEKATNIYLYGFEEEEENDEYTKVINNMEKRRKERKAKRIKKEINRQENLELISFLSLPFLVWFILII